MLWSITRCTTIWCCIYYSTFICKTISLCISTICCCLSCIWCCICSWTCCTFIFLTWWICFSIKCRYFSLIWWCLSSNRCWTWRCIIYCFFICIGTIIWTRTICFRVLSTIIRCCTIWLISPFFNTVIVLKGFVIYVNSFYPSINHIILSFKPCVYCYF